MHDTPRRHVFRMFARIGYLFFVKSADCGRLVNKSYDRISGGYDETWTHHMRDLTEDLLRRLAPQPGECCLDLTCGTGYATHLLAQKTQTTVIGVDRSEGMLAQAREHYGHCCQYVQADILTFLKSQPATSMDIITCCWGLGYSKPFSVLRQIKRVLRPGGKVAIIDNTLYSLREIMYCSFLTFAERPETLRHLMRFRFLPNSRVLRTMWAILNIKGLYFADGTKSYQAESGQAAIARLRATGAAAGFEYACDAADEEAVFRRFAEIVEEKYMTADGITVTHRYLAGIAHK